MNSKLAVVVMLLVASQSAFASRQGGVNNGVEINNEADAKAGRVVRDAKGVANQANHAAVGAKSGDAAAAAAAKAFGNQPAPRQAAKPAVVAPKVDAAKSVINEIKSARLGGNTDLAELETVLRGDQQLMNVAKEIIATQKSNPKLAELSEARLKGLVNISKLPSELRSMSKDRPGLPDESNAKAYARLVLVTGKQASNFPAGSQANVIEMLTTANAIIAEEKINMSTAGSAKIISACSSGFVAGQKALASKKVPVTAEDVIELCI